MFDALCLAPTADFIRTRPRWLGRRVRPPSSLAAPPCLRCRRVAGEPGLALRVLGQRSWLDRRFLPRGRKPCRKATCDSYAACSCFPTRRCSATPVWLPPSHGCPVSGQVRRPAGRRQEARCVAFRGARHHSWPPTRAVTLAGPVSHAVPLPRVTRPTPGAGRRRRRHQQRSGGWAGHLQRRHESPAACC